MLSLDCPVVARAIPGGEVRAGGATEGAAQPCSWAARLSREPVASSRRREVTQVVRDRVFPRETEVLVVGIEASGKTALVRALEGTAFTGASIPTVGFQIRKIQRSGLVVKVWDLGGQRRFRAMWHRYAGGVKVVLVRRSAACATRGSCVRVCDAKGSSACGVRSTWWTPRQRTRGTRRRGR